MKWTCVVIGIMLVFLPLNTHAQKAVGTFSVVKGQIQIKDPSGKLTPAKIGTKVREKDTIVAGKDSRAKLIMLDNNILNISPNTEVNLETYKFEPEKNDKNVLLNVIYGKIRSTVNQKYDGAQNRFHVKTPTAVAGVRGTDFLAGFQPVNKESTFVTFKGLVEVGQPGPSGSILNSVMVAPGQITTVLLNSPPATPTAVPKNELNHLNNESNTDKGGKNETRGPATPNNPTNNPQEMKEEQSPEMKPDGKQEQPKDPNKAPLPPNKAPLPPNKAPLPEASIQPAPKDLVLDANGQPANPPAPMMPGGAPGDNPNAPGFVRTPAHEATSPMPLGMQPPMGPNPLNSDLLMPPPPPMIEVVGPLLPNQFPMMPMIPQMPPFMPDPNCTFCKETLVNGPSKVNIIINGP